MDVSYWKAAPEGSVWNDGENWETGLVPTTNAGFGPSTVTTVNFAATSAATIETIVFDETAPSYTLLIEDLAVTPALTISGDGVKCAGTVNQNIAVTSLGTYNQPQLKFASNASAGSAQVHYYAGPPALETSYGGGTIAFHDNASAGEASFIIRTGKLAPPDRSSTLGGQVTFSDCAGASTATFLIYGTLGTDGDTFANAVFHDTASAQQATFVNYGGTVPGGDGGNTQFYDHSSAAQGIYLNHGGTAYDERGANGGDVAFDGLATGGTGRFNNYPASVANAYGGVTSFNNNPNYPAMAKEGASAGSGTFLNYGANAEFPGGGGHTEFTARYGFATADQATFYNFGSQLSDPSGAGHTSFSIGSPYASKEKGGEKSDPANEYFSSASNATIWNLPGAAGGYTVFKVYDSVVQDNQPTAGNAEIHNLAGDRVGTFGGYTTFQDTTTAGNATLIAYGGKSDGQGGQIIFEDTSTGDTAQVRLMGNGTLDASGRNTGLSIGALQTSDGIIKLALLQGVTSLTITCALELSSGSTSLELSMPEGETLQPGVSYPLLQAANLGDFSADQFHANSFSGAAPTLTVSGNVLSVVYSIIA